MKKISFIIFVLYFLILAVGGTIFYLKYIRHYTSAKTTPLQIETVNFRPLIYFSKKNLLSRIDPETIVSGSPARENFETQGEIGQLDLDQTKSQVAYEMKNVSDGWEIWQGDFNNLQKERVGFEDEDKFGNFQNFVSPHYSPDRSQLAFLAQGSTADTLFIKNLKDDSLRQMKVFENLKIADYSWSKDSNNLVYCSSNPPSGELKNACFKMDIESQEISKLFEAEVKEVSWENSDNIFYLSRGNPPHLYFFNSENGIQESIDDISAPKNIVHFKINPEGSKIAYLVVADQKSDLYISSVDGTDRLQLTTDGTTDQFVFAEGDGQKLAILRQKDGIYTIGLDKTDEVKIIGLDDSINYLQLWR